MSNVDEQEIAKFSELASRWWDTESEFKPLHLINPLRLDFVQQHCDGLFGKKVVDVGCGGCQQGIHGKTGRRSLWYRFGSGVS